MYQEIINGYSSVGDFFLIVLCGLLYVITRETFIKHERITRLFLHALVILPISCAANIMTWVAIEEEWNYRFMLLFRDVYHSGLLIIFFLYGCYVATIMGFEGKSYSRMIGFSLILNLNGIVFDCLSPITHWGLYCDSQGVWRDTIWLKPFAVCYTINMLFLAFLILMKRERLIQKVRYILILTQFMGVCLIVGENFYGHNSYMALSFTLPLISVLTMLHSNSYNIETGSLGDRAFDDYLQSRGDNKKQDSFLCIRFFTDEAFCMPRELGKIFYSFYQDYVNDGVVFNPSNNCYVLAVKNEKNQNAMQAIEVLVSDVFPKYYQQFKIDYKIIALEKPKVSSKGQFLDVFFYFLRKTEINNATFVYENDYDCFIKAQFLMEQLSDIEERGNLDDERVKIYMQPIKNVAKDQFDTAEALVRLQLPNVGMVFPDEFIPLAETGGTIHTLTRIVLNKTCKLVAELLDEGYDFERISINVSDVELDSLDFVKEFEKIVRSNNIPFEKVGVELTESRNDSDYGIVKDIIKELKQIGTPIYLDDFGTGYSNFERILKLHFDVIKIDRSLLLMADQNEDYKSLIKIFAEAFANLGYKVLYEGVETNVNVKNCISGHADYLQGYFFSKPVPMEQIREFFIKKKYEV